MGEDMNLGGRMIDDRVRLALQALTAAERALEVAQEAERAAKQQHKAAKEALEEAKSALWACQHRLKIAEGRAAQGALMPAWAPDPVWALNPSIDGRPRVVGIVDGRIVVRFNVSDAGIMRYSVRSGQPDAYWWRSDRWGRLDVAQTLVRWREACAARREAEEAPRG